MRLNKAYLSKIEEVFKENGYIVRYETGNFVSGYCIAKDRKIVIVNKFFKTEARIETLTDILRKMELEENSYPNSLLNPLLTDKSHTSVLVQ